MRRRISRQKAAVDLGRLFFEFKADSFLWLILSFLVLSNTTLIQRQTTILDMRVSSKHLHESSDFC